MTAANFHWATFSSWRSRRRGPPRQAPSRSSLGPDETTMTKVLQPGSADKKSSKNHQKRSEDDSKITFFLKKNDRTTVEKKKKTVRKRSDNDQKTTRKCLNYDQDLQGKRSGNDLFPFGRRPFSCSSQPRTKGLGVRRRKNSPPSAAPPWRPPRDYFCWSGKGARK